MGGWNVHQVLQSLRAGKTQVVEVPCPQVRPGWLLIQTRVTLISAGTERMVTDFAKASLIGKARQRPDQVRMVLEKMKTDGVMTTLESVFTKLDEAIELGYCNVGTVVAVGAGVTGFEVGDRVLSNGHHAEMVSVPQNLCAKVPEGVPDEQAVFGVLSSIALQGIRLAAPTLGECFLVSGLGLIGLLAVQLLRANGARVLGADFNPARLKLAQQLGAETVHLGQEDLIGRAQIFSRGAGMDGVLITAATGSHEPVHQAALVSRKRGRIVLVGVAGLNLNRDDFYRKELSFQVSCSYGPGRYDAEYEDQGRDYPLPFVRWTEQRNFTAVLDLIAQGQLDVSPLITHRFPICQASDAYDVVGGKEPSLGVLLLAPEDSPAQATALRNTTVSVPLSADKAKSVPTSNVVVGVIGAGGFASHVLLPAFQKAGVRFKAVASRGGVSAVHAAKRFGIEQATTDLKKVFEDPEINTVIIATRHDSHGDYVCRALAAGKHVFVEKPLCLTREELDRVIVAQAAAPQCKVMVGFNRRFAPQVQQMAKLLKGVAEPKSFVMTVNAGLLPADHWTHDPAVGGGRMIGEGCHFVDLLRYLAGQPIVDAQSLQMGENASVSISEDKLVCTLRFADGSFGTIHYLGNGHRSFSKERLEVFCAGRVLQLDNFLQLRGFGWPGFKKMGLWKQDKGHRAECAAFVEAIKTGGPSPIPFSELVEVTQATFDLVANAPTGGVTHYGSTPVTVPMPIVSTLPLARSA